MSDRETCRICRKPLANEYDVRTWEEAFSVDDPEDMPDEMTFMSHVCWSEQCGEHTDLGGVVIEDVEEYLIGRAEAAEAEVEAIHDALRDRKPTVDSSTAREVYGVASEVARLTAKLEAVGNRLDELITDMHSESNQKVSSDIWGTELEDCRALAKED